MTEQEEDLATEGAACEVVGSLEEEGGAPSSPAAANQDEQQSILHSKTEKDLGQLLEDSCREVTDFSSKPKPERDALYDAVLAIVSGRMTVSESSRAFGVAQSTMQPYVNRARALLGDHAPIVKNGRVPSTKGFSLDQWAAKQQHPATDDGGDESPTTTDPQPEDTPADSNDCQQPDDDVSTALPLNDEHLDSCSNAQAPLAAATTPDAETETKSRLSDDEPVSGHTVEDTLDAEVSAGAADDALHEAPPSVGQQDDDDDDPMSSALMIEEDSEGLADVEDEALIKFDSPEDAAREVLNSSDALTADGDAQQMFLAIVKCLTGDARSPAHAARLHGVDADNLHAAVDAARTLMAPSGRQQDDFHSTASGADGSPSGSRNAASSSYGQSNGSSTSIMGWRGGSQQTAIGPTPDELGLTDEEIEDAINSTLASSLYHGENRDRLYQAVMATIHRELPLTQAAAVYCVPFSTLHPYVKKVKLKLRLFHPQSPPPPAQQPPSIGAKTLAGLANRQRHISSNNPHRRNLSYQQRFGSYGLKRASDDAAGDDSPTGNGLEAPQQKRPRPEGFTPFRPISIPDEWKRHPELMRESVEKAVESCQYDSRDKKDRLCNAVFEALSGKTTMKAAAAGYGVRNACCV